MKKGEKRPQVPVYKKAVSSNLIIGKITWICTL